MINNLQGGGSSTSEAGSYRPVRWKEDIEAKLFRARGARHMDELREGLTNIETVIVQGEYQVGGRGFRARGARHMDELREGLTNIQTAIVQGEYQVGGRGTCALAGHIKKVIVVGEYQVGGMWTWVCGGHQYGHRGGGISGLLIGHIPVPLPWCF